MITVIAALDRVLIFSWGHILPIGFAIIFAIVLIKYARVLSSEKQQRLIHYIAIFISVSVIAFHVYNVIYNTYDIRTDLPLYLCSLLGILLPVYTT